MSEIKHLFNQTGTRQEFILEVASGSLAGSHTIEMPDKFEEMDAVVNIDDTFFNVNDFILGETTKLTFLEYSNPLGFSLVRAVFDELGSDAIVGFRWLVHNGADTTDILGDGYELNFNKYALSYEASMLKIEMEVKRRESQNKLLTREDLSVNLFSLNDMDDLPIAPLVTTDVHYKEGSRDKTNFYFFDSSQDDAIGYNKKDFFFLFAPSDDNDLGDRDYEMSGMWSALQGASTWEFPFLYTNSQMPALSVEVSNLNVLGQNSSISNQEFKLRAVKMKGGTITSSIDLATSTPDTNNGNPAARINIVNQSFPIGTLGPGEELYLRFTATDNAGLAFKAVDTQWSIEVIASQSTPLRKTRMVRLHTAIERVAQLLSGQSLTVESSLLSPGGAYYDTAISTGIFLRGVANIFLGEEKITTSLQTLMYDCVAPLLACGFDVRDNKLVVEDLDFFFSNTAAYDFSDKDFIHEGFSLKNDTELSFNQILMGSKKYSTDNKGDLLNFNTELEALTPLKSVKTKLDKTVEAIIDEDKIQELILDSSSTTNQGDDDLVLVDLVQAQNFVDSGVLVNCVHTIGTGGYLTLICFSTPFDTLPLSVGQIFTISSGINAGSYAITAIDKSKLTLNKTTGIVEGTSDTPISYVVGDVLKNRASEGFSSVVGVRDLATCTNLRHNPKYQLARWAPMYLGGLTKKPGLENVLVTEYKNNGNVTIEQYDLAGELPGTTTLNAPEALLDLRLFKDPLFLGEDIEVTIAEVTFSEFYAAYTAWRYGASGRGYITVPTPMGVKDIYPFGDGAFSFEGRFNELTLRGKTKYGVVGKSIQLDSAVDTEPNEVLYTWSFEGLEGATTLIEASRDGSVWNTLGQVPIEDLSASMMSSFFNTVLLGETIYFRVTANLMDTYFLKSNVLSMVWPYNSIVVRETLRNENVTCGQSTLVFEVEGADEIYVKFSMIGEEGSYMKVFDEDTGIELANVAVGGTYTSNKTIAGVVRYRVELYNTDNVSGTYVSCRQFSFEDTVYNLNADAFIEVKNVDETFLNNAYLNSYSTKYARYVAP